MKPGDPVEVKWSGAWVPATFRRLAKSTGTAWRDKARNIYWCELREHPTWGNLCFVKRDVRKPKGST